MKLLQYGNITHVIEIEEWEADSTSILIKNEQFLPGHLSFDQFPNKACAHYRHQDMISSSKDYPWILQFWE